MTIGFPGDTNQFLKDLQNAKIRELLFYMFDHARYRYLDASKLIGIQTPMAVQLRKINSFSIETLRGAYETIASYFRFAHDNHQVPLPFTTQSYEEFLEAAWCDFYYSEIRNLVEMDDIALAILRAVSGDTNEGVIASEYLAQALAEKYRSRIEYLKRESEQAN